MTATLQIPEKPITLMQAAQLLADAVCPNDPQGVRAWLNLLLAKAHSGEIQGRLSQTLAPLDTTGIWPADYAEQAVLTPNDLRRVAVGSDLHIEEGSNLAAAPAPVVADSASNAPAKETTENRNDRWLDMRNEEARTGPEAGAQARAIRRIVATEGVTEHAAKKGIQTAGKARAESYRAGGLRPIKTMKNSASDPFNRVKSLKRRAT